MLSSSRTEHTHVPVYDDHFLQLVAIAGWQTSGLCRYTVQCTYVMTIDQSKLTNLTVFVSMIC